MDYEISLLTTMGVSVLFALSLNLITGFCGQISLGHAAFLGIGAYVAASAVLAAAGMGLPTWLSFPLFLISAILVGVVVGGLVEALLLRRIYGKEEVLQLLVTFAVFMILEDAQKVVFGTQPLFANAPMNWRGLFLRLAILGLAVVVTALALRVLVVRA